MVSRGIPASDCSEQGSQCSFCNAKRMGRICHQVLPLSGGIFPPILDWAEIARHGRRHRGVRVERCRVVKAIAPGGDPTLVHEADKTKQSKISSKRKKEAMMVNLMRSNQAQFCPIAHHKYSL